MLYIAFCALYLGTFTYCIFLKASCKRKVKNLFGYKRLKGKQIVISFTNYLSMFYKVYYGTYVQTSKSLYFKDCWSHLIY